MCVLRAFGESFDPKRFLTESPLLPYSVYERGARRFPTSAKLNEQSGLKVEVSSAEWNNVAAQFDDALRFIRTHHAELTRLRSAPGIEALVLDFPIEAGEFATFVRCPTDLAAESAALGVELEFSIYPQLSATTQKDS